jgi:SAM-dependent methyltransferase
MSTPGSYLLDTAAAAERERLRVSAQWWDPFTFRRLDEIGVDTGWRCLEIGAGTGSVAQWLTERVGRGGHVVATDIHTRWIEDLAQPNLEVRHHNVADEPIEDGYDLIHARLVLEHLPQRSVVVAKLVDALNPGGWLVVEDYDLRTITVAEPPDDAWAAMGAAMVAVLEAGGVDPYYGSRLLSDLMAAGLGAVAAEGAVRPCRVVDMAALFRPVIARFRDHMVATGIATAGEIDRGLATFDDAAGRATTYTPILVSARGRKPTSE